MKKVNTKKIVLLSSFTTIALYVVADLIFSYDRCFAAGRCPALYDFIHSIAPLVLTLLPLFFLSLVTYKMRNEVFHAWWNFARWWASVIVVVTLLLNSASNSGGLGIESAVSGAFDILTLIILYAILVVVSLVKIVRAYNHSKK